MCMVSDRFIHRASVWRLRTRSLALPRQPLLMGILNVTPDSFSDGGQFLDAAAAVAHARALVADGADLLDVGGESTRPGAAPVSGEEEIARVLPVIRRLVDEIEVPISIDTRKACVAQAAIVLAIKALKSGPEVAFGSWAVAAPAIHATSRAQPTA